MNGLIQHLGLAMRLHFRNRMALLYGYLFPLIFVAAFAVLYRHEKVPLLHHLGELLTIGVLGGACFGLPTTLVSERERGVWRRYRLVPVPTWMLVTSTVVARYLLLLSAAVLQVGAALAIGMTQPVHPFDLFAVFTFVAFAFIGLGLVIAMLAGSVPAVQALGQCIFLPMLVIGGVAVPLTSLPDWAQHLSAFFPGRYSVEALQATVTGDGLRDLHFSLAALTLIGFAACVTGGKLFRWDNGEHTPRIAGRSWLALTLAAWLAAGGLAEWQDGIAAHVVEGAAAAAQTGSSPWSHLTANDIANLEWRVPPDEGVVTPIGSLDQAEEHVAEEIERVRNALPAWPPGREGDDVQKVRNLLCIAAVADLSQSPLERYLPLAVLEHLETRYPKGKLIRMLAWIAQHPEGGTVRDDLADLGLPATAGDEEQIRVRVSIYAVKLVARLTGRSTG